MNEIKVNNGSTSGATLLQITFIVLKLCGVINWSWVWVLSPLWIGTIIAIICIVLIVIIKKGKFRND